MRMDALPVPVTQSLMLPVFRASPCGIRQAAPNQPPLQEAKMPIRDVCRRTERALFFDRVLLWGTVAVLVTMSAAVSLSGLYYVAVSTGLVEG